MTQEAKELNYSDECYTPPLVYAAVRDWACEEYNIDPETVIRPFFPGGDYQNCNYRDGWTVIDNPPFSILSEICAFYLAHNIKFFLFAPALTAFGQRTNLLQMTVIFTGNIVTYENGIKIPTAFLTNCENSEIISRTVPKLAEYIEEAQAATYGTRKTSGVSYEYPNNLVSPAMLHKYSRYGIEITLRRDECIPISQLDSQIVSGKGVFGGGLLVSDRIAAARSDAEQYIAEQTKPIRMELSAREKELVSNLSK